MGWNSWNSFDKQIDEGLIRQQADAMVSSGMRDAGYTYIVVDAGWRAATRDADGNMQVNEKFPSGMKALADYVHSKGLKFGLHQSMALTSCGDDQSPGTTSAPGDTYAEKARHDAETFAEWGIDYLKFDWCKATDREQKIIAMRDALEETGRPIFYSINPGAPHDRTWAGEADMWRTTPDITPCWENNCKLDRSVTEIIDQNEPFADAAGPGHWNDPDMLQVGVEDTIKYPGPGLTDVEARAHFSLWALMASPLIAGNDLRNMTDATLETLTNEEVIAVNQDPAGIQGERVSDDGSQEVWVKPLANGDRAVVLFNRGETSARISTSAREVGMREAPIYLVRDLWDHKQRASEGEIEASVPSHGVAVFRVEAKGPEMTPPGREQ